MKRYEENYHICEMEESEDGEWVKFEDVEEYLNDIFLTANEIESCSCQKNIDRLSRIKSPLESIQTFYEPKHWTCPAHGYKKL